MLKRSSSRGTAEHRDRLAIVTLVFVGLVLIGGCNLILGRTIDGMVRTDAEQTATGWMKYLLQQVKDVEQIAEGQAASEESNAIIRQVALVGNVFRFKIFDGQGHLRLVSDALGRDWSNEPTLAAHNPPAAEATRRGAAFSEVKRGTPPRRPEVYAETYLPVFREGRLAAIVEVYVNQSERHATLSQQVLTSAASLAGLVMLAFAIPGVAFHLRSRQRRRAEDRVTFLSQHDEMTSLLNRGTFTEGMDAALAKGPAVALFVDLDRFKEINDGLGHDIGDGILRITAERLVRCVPAHATVARLGGDEFAVLVPAAMDEAAIAALAQRMIDALCAPCQVSGHDVVVNASIGVSIAPHHATDATSLLRCADLALYAAKSAGRATYRVFESSMEDEFQRRRKLEGLIRAKAASGGFELYFQPLVNGESGKIVGYEALLRLQDDDGTFIGPNTFIPVAEEMGLIPVIGELVLQRACQTAATWSDELSISVNLSPLQFGRGDLAATVDSALRKSGLKARRLELEITEGILLHHTESVLDELKALKAMGVSIVMDDFGTGYSSLNYLWKFPFDKIKIDRSFMNQLGGDTSQAASVVRSIVELGHSLKMVVTAEGVETATQADFLRNVNCDYLQGFHFGRPMPATDVAGHLIRSFASREVTGPEPAMQPQAISAAG